VLWDANRQVRRYQYGGQVMKSKHILLVEDDMGMREVLRDILTDEGFKITTAENGKIALNKLDEYTFDLILTDLKMPQMDGMEFLEYVEKNHPTTKVIVITAYGEKDNYNQAKYLGAFEFLSKSIRVEELKKVINRVISRKNET